MKAACAELRRGTHVQSPKASREGLLLRSGGLDADIALLRKALLLASLQWSGPHSLQLLEGDKQQQQQSADASLGEWWGSLGSYAVRGTAVWSWVLFWRRGQPQTYHIG